MKLPLMSETPGSGLGITKVEASGSWTAKRWTGLLAVFSSETRTDWKRVPAGTWVASVAGSSHAHGGRGGSPGASGGKGGDPGGVQFFGNGATGSGLNPFESSSIGPLWQMAQ